MQKWWDEKIAALAANADWQKVVRDNFMGNTHTRTDGLKAYMQGLHDSRLKILREIGAAKL